MKITSVRHCEGPNVYLYKPVMVARIDLMDLSERESYEFAGFADRLLRMLPGLREHHCAKGEPGGFVERLYGGTYFGHIVEHVAIELACLAGLDVHFGKTLYADRVGHYDIVMECKAYPCQKNILFDAVDLVQTLVVGHGYDVEAVVRRAQRHLGEWQLGPSTRAVVEAAEERGIPVRRLSRGSLVQLGYGRYRKLIEATITEHTSAVWVDVASDKSLTKEILSQAGISVPLGQSVFSADEAVEALQRIGGPVVLKPGSASQGKGVSLNLTTESQVRQAYESASAFGSDVLVEECLPGSNVRVLVVDGQYVAASQRFPAGVSGDGVRTVRELIELANQDDRRGNDHEKPLTRIELDDMAIQTLGKQGLTLDSVPEEKTRVWLRESANLSTGGEAIDITEDLHPTYRKIAERTARLIGLDVCGIDMMIATDIREEGQHAVIEVNAAPGIRMHEHPSYGVKRHVGQRIVESLFGPHASGRIPIVAVTGTNGKTTTTRLIAHGLASTGKVVGTTTTGGVYIGQHKIVSGDTTGPDSARMVLSDPLVEAAVLETARGGIVRGGLAYDKADVGVITNITLDHVGQDGIDDLDDLVHVKSLVAECVHETGTVVLNAEDSSLVQLSRRLKSRVAFFASSPNNPVLKRHLACGGVGYYVERGWLVEGRGNLNWELIPIVEIPLTLQGKAAFHVENCLAAAAALRAQGLSRQQVAAALASFNPLEHNPGRCVIYEMPRGGHIVLDYGHNPDGFEKMGSWLHKTPNHRLLGVVGVPGDRADHIICQSARQLARVFDQFIVKEDEDKRGRTPGEVAGMMAAEIGHQCPEKPCTIELDEVRALERAAGNLASGDVAVVFYEHLEPLQRWVEGHGGRQVSDIHAFRDAASIAVR